MAARLWIIIAGLLGAGAVTLGAYHAHGLDAWLEKKELTTAELAERMHHCEVAVKYQMYHALAILGIGILAARRCTWSLSLAALAMLLGVFAFSGGLYFIVFDLPELHWSIVPLGGLLMIVGWVLLAIAAFTIAVDRDKPK